MSEDQPRKLYCWTKCAQPKNRIVESPWITDNESSNTINIMAEELPLVNFDQHGINYDGPVPDVATNNVVVPNSKIELTEGTAIAFVEHSKSSQ